MGWAVGDSYYGTTKAFRLPTPRQHQTVVRLVLRWDHGVPQLDLLIDGRVVIVADGYERYWPTKYPDRLLIGCWPNYSHVHYADTYFWRTQLLSECATEDWVTAELKRVVPGVVA